MGDMERFSVQGATLHAVGDLETADLAEFESACNYLASRTEEHELLFDFTRVDHMASLYISVLLSFRRRLAEQGRCFVLRPSPVVRELLEITGESQLIAAAE